MAKVTEITVEVKVEIPSDTILRCLRILEMWMDDHPHDRIIVDRKATTDGYRHQIFIERSTENDPV